MAKTLKGEIRDVLFALDAVNTAGASEEIAALLRGVEDDLEKAEKLAASEEK
jgi:hypothetical protein